VVAFLPCLASSAPPPPKKKTFFKHNILKKWLCIFIVISPNKLKQYYCLPFHVTAYVNCCMGTNRFIVAPNKREIVHFLHEYFLVYSSKVNFSWMSSDTCPITLHTSSKWIKDREPRTYTLHEAGLSYNGFHHIIYISVCFYGKQLIFTPYSTLYNYWNSLWYINS
jgi:hypothetical protein